MNADNKPFILYKASAGSGKTYTLIKEFLILCLNNDEKYYKEILAVTFTNKAANEMKAKILANLKDIMENDTKASDMMNDLHVETGFNHEEIREKAKRLFANIIHNYSDFNISTIDSFVQQVSRAFAKELNLPSQYKVLLDDDELLDEILQRIDKKIGDDDMFTEILSEFTVFKLDNEENERIDSPIRSYVKKLLKENSYRKGESLNVVSLDKSQYHDVRNYLNNKISKLESSIHYNIKKIEDTIIKYHITEDCYDGKSKGLINILDKIHKLDDIKKVEPSSLLTQTTKNIMLKREWVHKKAPKDVINKLICDNIDVMKMYETLVRDCNYMYFVNILRDDFYLYVLRGKLMEIVREYIDDTYKVHISEFNKRISDVLGDCSVPFIYERIGARYRHFFIDEFQDTSVLQWFNFLPLIDNSLSFGNKNLLVGDAKQAIYRFRSGEVEQIIKLPDIHQRPDNEFGTNCEASFKQNWNPKQLKTNYRTKKNIVKFNNDFFDYSKDVLANDLYKSVYADNMRQNIREKDYDGFVKVEIFKMNSFKEEGRRTVNQTLYKNAVKESILNDIVELKEKGYSFKDVTILVRTSADGSDIAEFLTKSKHEIPVVSSDSISLKSSDKVMLIITTLFYLSDENNDVFKLSMNYYRESCDNPETDVRDLSDVIRKFNVNDIDDIKSNTLSIYDLCVRIAKFYNLDIADDIFLQYLMNVINDWQNAEHGGLNEFLDYWKRKSASFYVKTSSDIDAVQIMTIHKSKGLEFKIVMYPYAFTQLPEKFKGEEMWLSCRNDFNAIHDIPHIDNFILPINKKLTNTIFEKFYIEEKEKASFDDFNIMYVAMTRPKDMLFVYTNDSKSKENNYNLLHDYLENDKDKYSLLSGNNDDDISYIYEIGEICRNRHYEETIDENIIESDDNHNPATINWTDVIKVETEPVMISSSKKLYQPQEWGVLVHEILSKIKTKNDAQHVILPYIYKGSIDERQAELLMKQFEEITSFDEIKDAYSDDCIIRNEMEILTFDGHIIRPDRYAELSDKIILIDYKTGKKDDDYHNQIVTYTSALKKMNIDKKVEAFLVYLREDKIEIEPVKYSIS